jgi:hypothetical protein
MNVNRLDTLIAVRQSGPLPAMSPVPRRGADAIADRVLDCLQLSSGHHIVRQQSLHQFIDEGSEKMQFGSLRRLVLAV